MKIQRCTFSEVTDLKSNHSEADSRMFSHIFQAAKTQNADIIILSADTDVFVLGIYFWHKLAQTGCRGLRFDGSHKKKCVLGCHLTAQSLREGICNISVSYTHLDVYKRQFLYCY